MNVNEQRMEMHQTIETQKEDHTDEVSREMPCENITFSNLLSGTPVPELSQTQVSSTYCDSHLNIDTPTSLTHSSLRSDHCTTLAKSLNATYPKSSVYSAVKPVLSSIGHGIDEKKVFNPIPPKNLQIMSNDVVPPPAPPLLPSKNCVIIQVKGNSVTTSSDDCSSAKVVMAPPPLKQNIQQREDAEKCLNSIERKRQCRQNLKTMFMILRQSVPKLEHKPNSTRLCIIKEAEKYISSLKSIDKIQEQQMRSLNLNRMILNNIQTQFRNQQKMDDIEIKMPWKQ